MTMRQQVNHFKQNADDHFTGKVALITGASRGIGAATAQLFAQVGAIVVLASRSEEELARLWWLHEISAEKIDCLPLQLLCYLTRDMQIESRLG